MAPSIYVYYDLKSDAARHHFQLGGAIFGFMIINENRYMVAAQALHRTGNLYESMTIFFLP